MRSAWKKGLSFIVSASMVASLVPAPALAEIIEATPSDDGSAVVGEPASPEEREEELAPEAAPATDPAPDEEPQAELTPQDAGDEGSDPGEPQAELTPQDAGDEGSDPGEPQAMQLDESYTVSVEDGGDWFGSFTAPADGVYVFESAGIDGAYTDTYGELYNVVDGELEILAEDDDSAGNGSFRIVQELTQNQTVQLKVRAYSDNAITCTVSVSEFDTHDLDTAAISYESFRAYYKEGVAALGISVCDAAGNKLTEGTDYELVFRTLTYDESGDEILEEGDESTEVPTAIGAYRIFARGIGDYSGNTDTRIVRLYDPFDLATEAYLHIWDKNPAVYTYSGVPPVMDVRVHLGDPEELYEDTPALDAACYELVYVNANGEESTTAPSATGTYSVYARGLGDYHNATQAQSFTIAKTNDLAVAKLTFNQYSFDLADESVDIEARVVDANGNELTEGIDYEVVFRRDDSDQETTEPPTARAIYYVYARALESGGYTGRTAEKNIIVNDSKDIELFLDYDNNPYYWEFDYTGSAVDVPVPTFAGWRDESYISLTEGTDFEFDHLEDEDGARLPNEAKDPGTYYAVWRGIGEYRGSCRTLFFIYPSANDLSFGRIVLYTTTYYLGSDPIELSYDVEDANDSRVPEDAYELVYFDAHGNEIGEAPSQSGNYFVAARALEDSDYDYTKETEKQPFEIIGYDNIGHYAYGFTILDGDTYLIGTDSPVVLPEVRLSRWDEDEEDYVYLEEGTDYELAGFLDEEGNELDKTPSALGDYYAQYRGIGDYTGTKRLWFNICDAHELRAASLTVASQVPLVDGVATPEVTVSDLSGTKLTEGIDYELRFFSEDEQPLTTLTTLGTYYVQAVPATDSAYTGESSRYGFEVYDPCDLERDWAWGATFDPERLPFEISTLPAPHIHTYDADGYGLPNLVLGTDIELDHIESRPADGEDPQDLGTSIPAVAGSYRAVYRGIGSYHGTIGVNFELYDPNGLGNGLWQARFATSSELPSGAEELPAALVYGQDSADPHAYKRLREGVDFQLDHIAPSVYDEDACETVPGSENLGTAVPSEPGDYFAVFRGIGTYSGTCALAFNVYDTHDINGGYWSGQLAGASMWNASRSVYYTDGAPVELGALVLWRQDPDVVLVENKDFVRTGFSTLDGKALDAAPSADGFYYAIYQGIGDYHGTRRVRFEVDTSYDLSHATLRLYETSFAYNGESVSVKVKVRDQAGIKLTEGLDYRLVYRDADGNVLEGAPVERGRYTVCAVAAEDGRYLGETAARSLTIGDGETPDPTPDPTERLTMMLDETLPMDLSEGEEWQGAFTAPAAGVYVFSSTGEYDTYGVLSAKENPKVALVSDDDGGVGSNFRIRYHLSAGETVYLRAYEYSHEAMTGAVSVCKLDARDLANATMRSEGDAQEGALVVPCVTITSADGVQLTEGTDYDLVYFDAWDKEVDKPTVAGDYTVRAMAREGSGYTGQTSALGVRIYSATDITGMDLVWTSELSLGGSLDNPITLTAWDGTTLKEGTDYEILYYTEQHDIAERMDGVPASVGTYRMWARAIGTTYTGEVGPFNLHVVDTNDISGDRYYLGWESFAYREAIVGNLHDVPVYRYAGEPVEPEAYLWCSDGDNEESPIFTTSYVRNGDPAKDGGIATATVSGADGYTGSRTYTYRVVDRYDLANYVAYNGGYVTMGNKNEDIPTLYASENAPVSLLVDDYPAEPRVTLYGSDAPVQDYDFTISFATETGEPLDKAPVKQGKYLLVLSATDNGICTGSAKIRFALTASHDLLGDASSMPQLKDSAYYDYSTQTSDGLVSINLLDTLEAAGNIVVQLWDGGVALVENLDYTVNTLADGFLEFIGLGHYEDSVRARICGAESQQASFVNRRATVGETDYEDRIGTAPIDATGTLLEPDITVYGLVYGVDYVFGGYEDAAGKALTTAKSGQLLYARLNGVGAFEGCTRTLPVYATLVSPARDISAPYAVGVNLANGVRHGDEHGPYTWYMVRSATPQVSLTVYGNGLSYASDTTELNDGQGITVTSASSGDNALKLTIAADEDVPFTGSRTENVQLVDSFDLATFAPRISALDPLGNVYTAYLDGSGTLRLSYAGIDYLPKLTFYADTNFDIAVQPTYDLVLKNSDGAVVDAVTQPGTYTLVLTGTGDWSGTVELPLEVSATSRSIRLSGCTLTVGGDTELRDGEAKPSVTLVSGAYTLQEGKDYTLTYGANTESGARGWVRADAVEGSAFVGSAKANFTVGTAGTHIHASTHVLYLAEPDGSGFFATSKQARSYTAGDLRMYNLRMYKIAQGASGPAVKLYARDENGNLSEVAASNYSVAYGDLTHSGKSYVTVTGTGDYSGSLSANFYVASVPQPIDLAAAKASVKLGATSYTYDGKVKSPGVKSVVVNGTTLVAGTDYTVATPSGRKNAGTYTYKITGTGRYTGTVAASFTIKKAKSTITLAAQTKKWTGKAQTYSGKVAKKGSDGAVSYAYYSDATCKKAVKPANVKAVGTYYVRATVAAKGNYAAATSAAVKFIIAKANNTLAVKAANKTASAKTLKKKAVAVAAPVKITKKGQGALSYAKAKGTASCLTVNSKNGKVTIKKGTKKGKYKIVLKVTAKGDVSHNKVTKTVTAYIQVK